METAIMSAMCRCCASEGVFKDVKSSYTWMGDEEVYADMLRECFDITLSTSDHCEDGGICEVCITQLRNASNFKKQVLHTEEQFKKHVNNKLFKPSIVKVEVSAEEDIDSDDNNMSAEEAYSGPEYEIPIKTETEEPKPKKRAAASKATTSRAKKAKTESGESSTKRRRQKRVVTDNDETESEDEAVGTLTKNKIAPRSDLVKHRYNINTILQSSNATPIRRYEGIGYTCCFCEDQFPNPGDLKKHTLENHKDVSGANFMKNMNMSEYVIKLDVTGLTCKLCNTEISTLENLIHHLNDVHKKTIYTDIKNHIFPFKFDNADIIQCTNCSNSFNKFRPLVRHMHIHYRNFICKICDSGFVNRNTLTQHLENHRIGEFACSFCKKIYATQVKKRLHERTVHTHSDSMNKCGYCTETFKDYIKREAHLESAHGVKSVSPKCQACDRVFRNRKLLTIHVKRDHLMERPHQCSECEMKFFSSTGLKNHMVKHTGSRAFSCTICLKSYGRKKTLNSHMRVHREERFKCEHCDRAFVQKCSWKSHMQSKHDENV